MLVVWVDGDTELPPPNNSSTGGVMDKRLANPINEPSVIDRGVGHP